MIDELIERTPVVLEEVGANLPDGYPCAVFEAISKGMLDAAKRLRCEPGQRKAGDA